MSPDDRLTGYATANVTVPTDGEVAYMAELLRTSLGAIGDAYGRIPAGWPTREEYDARVTELLDVIGRQLRLIHHPFASDPVPDGDGIDARFVYRIDGDPYTETERADG